MERGTISHIDAVLSTHFNECSISAADAAREAARNINDATDVQNFQPIGRYKSDTLQPFQTYPLATLPFSHDALVEDTVTFALVKHDEIDEVPTALVAIINHDAILPLATFEERSDGECSYIQLGQEIDDDSLVVTPDAPRSEYVEELRRNLTDRRNTHNEYDWRHTLRLLTGELDIEREYAESALNPSATRLAAKVWEDLSSTKNNGLAHPANLTVMDETDGERIARMYDVREISLPPALTNKFGLDTIDGREVRLVLARDVPAEASTAPTNRRFFSRLFGASLSEEPASTKLLAVVRNDLALQLAEFNPDGSCTVGQERTPCDPMTAKLLIKTLQEEAKWTDFQRFCESEFSVADNENIPRVHDDDQYWYHIELDLSKEATAKFGRRFGNTYSTDIDVNFKKRNVKSFLLQAVGNALPERRELAYTPGKVAGTLPELFSRLHVAGRLREQLGPSDSFAERLIVHLGTLVSEPGTHTFSGVLHNQKAGKTTTDVDTTVDITRDEHTFHVLTRGRPSALANFPPATLFDVVLLLDHPNKTDETLPELTKVVQSICSVEA